MGSARGLMWFDRWALWFPVYWGLSNRLVLVKCTLRWLCRVFIVPLRNTDNLSCLPPARSAPPSTCLCRGKSIIWNDQISAALILSRYSVWHSLQLQDRSSSRQCVLGTALFLAIAVCKRARKETWLLLVRFLYLTFPGAVIMVSTCGHGLWHRLSCSPGLIITAWPAAPGGGLASLSLFLSLPTLSRFPGFWIDTAPYGKRHGTPKLLEDCSGTWRNCVLLHKSPLYIRSCTEYILHILQ